MNFPLEFPTWILKKSPWGDKYTNVLIFGWFGGTPISGNLNIYIYIYIHRYTSRYTYRYEYGTGTGTG